MRYDLVSLSIFIAVAEAQNLAHVARRRHIAPYSHFHHFHRPDALFISPHRAVFAHYPQTDIEEHTGIAVLPGIKTTSCGRDSEAGCLHNAADGRAATPDARVPVGRR